MMGVLQVASLVICLWMTFGLKPSVRAQSISNEDAVQDTQIEQINEHLRNTDSIAERQGNKIDALAASVAEMQGEERAAFAFLTLLTGSSIVLQVRRKKVGD